MTITVKDLKDRPPADPTTIQVTVPAPARAAMRGTRLRNDSLALETERRVDDGFGEG